MKAPGATTYRVLACNTAAASENRIHDDEVARRFGFRGGLVPGADVYAYMTHPVVERWGRGWLERGAMNVRFLRPVYDGEMLDIVCQGGAAEQALEIAARNAAGATCASGRALLPRQPVEPPEIAHFPRGPLPDPPPPASTETLRPGSLLGTVDVKFNAGDAESYLHEVRESLAIYLDERIAHPGYLLRNANYVLALNVTLGPWLHVASDAQHHGVAGDGDRVSTRARVLDAYAGRGHKFVELDVLMVANDERPLVRLRHTAIYEPRQSRA